MAIRTDVPFIPNPDNRCLVCCVGMLLGCFYPDKKYTMQELEAFSGYVEGEGTWPMQHLLRMADMGIEFRVISDWDMHKFVDDPEGYIRELSTDQVSLEYQLKHSDLPGERERYVEYMRRNLPYEKRRGTFDDVRKFLDDGWIVRLGVNINMLNGEEGYVGHSLLVLGYDKDGPVLHNPDSANNRPNQRVTWDELEKAWQDFGDQSTVYAYRRKS
jgi:hypothetical protein